MDQDAGEDGPGVHRAAVAGEVRGAAHGLPGGGLPQHLRVLGGPRGDVPHRRRPVHPPLRLLPDRHRQAAAARPRRAAPGRRVSVQKMELRYATITGVARDDLPDGGAWLYAETVRAIHELNPGTGVGEPDPRLQRQARPAAPRSSRAAPRCSPTTSRPCRASSSGSARRSATTARSTCSPQARDFGLVTKSNLILGMGETREEVSQALRDLHEAGCELVTITQYLRPSAAPPPGRALGQARGVRRAGRRGRGDRLLRRAVRPARAFVVPRRSAVPSGHGGPYAGLTTHPRPSPRLTSTE